MNVTHSFAKYLQAQSYGTLGVNLFIGGVPQSAPDECFWLVSSGGNNLVKNDTGGKQKNFIINLYYRSTSSEDVYDTMQDLQDLINGSSCLEIEDYTVLEAETTLFPTDQDLDIEEATIGLMTITLTIYQS